VPDCDFLPPAIVASSRLDAKHMNSDTQLVPPATARWPLSTRRSTRGRGWFARLRSDPERMTAVRESWRALWSSRLLVWTVAVTTIAAFGFGPQRKAFNPPGLTKGFGWLGDVLAAPAARWDSSWYLEIARYGYRPDLGASSAARQAYFPLYPLAMRAVAWLGTPPVLAGVLVSVGAFALALYGIHRLTTLELGGGSHPALASAQARLAVVVMAFAPMAFFFSAVYSESLYMALSVGVFWSARHGRWRWVAMLGALATATRSTGMVLLVPALMIYLYGPREDRPPDRPGARGLGVRVRYRPGREALWLAAFPLGAILFGLYLGLAGGNPLGFMHAEGVWGRQLMVPFGGIWDGLGAAFEGARQLLSAQSHHAYFAAGQGNPIVGAEHNLLMIAFVAFAVAAIAGVLRRLPLAYGVYVIAALALPLSDPVRSEPLQSVPRFMVVLFPLGIWLAAWLAERPRAQRPVVVFSAALMALFVAQFATWHWVA
jgi:Mannosyltransferase (PIG-V)